ncbi:isochorismatase family cysteine hydrolase [Pannus brasiliensis CCIBt3594]|uniref:Isochorismatase family cysteine hydrolase n=1 Tax=Pannus brasiliensis CCIBt3594 TaxID=1427578 RepID=A0AAW9R0M2_9CHRO
MDTLTRSIPKNKIHSTNTALLVIDMQRDFIDVGAVLETPGGRELVEKINRLIAWARLQEIPIIFTREMHRSDKSDFGIELEYEPVHCLEGTPGSELTDGLDARPEDYYLINKRRYDCFAGTELDLFLRSKRIENLICCGVLAQVCVLSTVLSARNLDYRAIVPRDAIAGSSPEYEAAALLCMGSAFAYLSSIEEIIALESL